MGAIYNDDWNEDCTHLMYVADNSGVSHIPQFGDVDVSAEDAHLLWEICSHLQISGYVTLLTRKPLEVLKSFGAHLLFISRGYGSKLRFG
jgi:hypothetical protein